MGTPASRIVQCSSYGQVLERINDPPDWVTSYEDGNVRHISKKQSQYIENLRVCAYPFAHRYVSEMLTVERFLRQLDYHVASFVSTQTGGGKTTWTIKIVAGYMRKHGRRIAVFCSRAALKLKLKYDAIDAAGTDQKECLTLTGIRKQCEFGNIDIFSYQDIFGDYGSAHLEDFKKHLPEYGVVFFDEIHFLVSDAEFNGYTQKICEELSGLCYRDKIPRVYMTATPEYVFDIILRREQTLAEGSMDLYTLKRACQQGYYNESPVMNFYHFGRDYSYINFNTFPLDENGNCPKQVQMIRESSGCKWLILTDSKCRGEQLRKELTAKEVKLLNSDLIHPEGGRKMDSDIEELMNELTLNETMPCDVLIATKCLDVGITIKDTPVNIVCFLTDPVDFIQGIGRKRVCRQNDKVELYVPAYTKADVNRWHQSTVNALTEYRTVCERYPEGNKASGAHFPVPVLVDNGVYKHNTYLGEKLRFRKRMLERLLSQIDRSESDEICIANFYRSLLELPPVRLEALNSECADRRQKLMEIVDQYKNAAFDEERAQMLFSELKAYDNRARVKDRPFTTNAANLVLNEIGYKVEKEKDVYRIFPLNAKGD